MYRRQYRSRANVAQLSLVRDVQHVAPAPAPLLYALFEQKLSILILEEERASTNEDSFDEFQLPAELPFPRNQFFCGREDLINRIHAIFHPAKSKVDMAAPTSTTWQLIALHGLGGIGKTQIALEYAHRYEQLYSAILWVDAKDRTVLESSGVRILQQLVYHYATRSPFTSALPLNSVSQVVSIFLAPSSRR